MEIGRKNTLETKAAWEKVNAIPPAFRPYWDRLWENYMTNAAPPLTGPQLAHERAAPVLDEAYAKLAAEAERAASSQMPRDFARFARACNCGVPEDPSTFLQRRPEASRP